MINQPLTNSAYLIEDCYKLHLGSLGKRLLAPIAIEQSDNFDKTKKIGRSGTTLLLNGLSLMRLDYMVNLNLTPNIINVKFYNDSRKRSIGVNQVIEIQKQELLFGTRFFFKCRCGKRLNVLYLRSDLPYFACRKCLNLKYYLTTINRHSLGRELFYWFNRSQKVKEKLASIKQFTHRGKATKKAASALHYANKYNLINNAVAIATIKEQMSRLGIKQNLQNI